MKGRGQGEEARGRWLGRWKRERGRWKRERMRGLVRGVETKEFEFGERSGGGKEGDGRRRW